MTGPVELLIPGTLNVPAKALSFAGAAADRVLYTRGCILMGWAVVEATGAAVATAAIRGGADASAPILVPISLAAAATATGILSPSGLIAESGIYLDIESGSITGSVWIIDYAQ